MKYGYRLAQKNYRYFISSCTIYHLAETLGCAELFASNNSVKNRQVMKKMDVSEEIRNTNMQSIPSKVHGQKLFLSVTKKVIQVSLQIA